MSYCPPCPPCDSEFPLLCEPLETTANGRRIVVEDSAACQKTMQTPFAQQVLKTDGAGNLNWTNGKNKTVLAKSVTGDVEFAQVQTDYIEDNAVTTAKLAGLSVTTNIIADGAVTGTKIPDKTITNLKLRDSAGLSVIGQPADTSGVPSDITSSTDGDVLRRNGAYIGFGKIGFLSMDGGGIVNVVNASSARSFTIVASAGTDPEIIPLDNTAPQISEGVEILSVSITPKKAGNKIFGLISFNGDASSGSLATIAGVFKNGEELAIAATWSQSISTASLVSFDFFDVAASASSITYTVRVGPSAAGTLWINRNNSTELLGDSNFIRFTLFEINA